MARFWEGTGLLHQMKGEWFDTVSNCVTFTISANKERVKEVEQFRHTIVRLMSLCHGSALEEISRIEGRMETIDVCGLNTATLKHLKDCVENHRFNKVEVLLHLLQSLITDAHEKGVIAIPPPILSRVYQTISRGYVNLLNTKKITDTKFPFPYVQLIAALLLLHSIVTPLVLSACVDSLVLAPLMAFVPVFGAHAMNFISMELEDPFGEDDNDLPLAHFQTEMNNCLLMLLHPNTDIIAGVSDKCIMDFDKLKTTVAISDAFMGKEDSVEEQPPPRRISVKLFDPTFNVIGSRSNLENALQPASSFNSNTSTEVEGEEAGGVTRATASPTRGNEQDVPSGAIGDERVARGPVGRTLGKPACAIAVEQAHGDFSNVSDPEPWPPHVSSKPTIGGIRPFPEPRLLKGKDIRRVLSKEMEDINQSLRAWTRTIEAQVAELTERMSAVNAATIQTGGP